MRPDDAPDDVFEREVADEPVFLPDGHLSEGGAHAFVDGALADADAARAIAHVAACARCAGVVAEARGLAAAATRILGALDDVPAGVVPNVAAAAAPVEPAPPVAPVVELATRRAGPRPRARWTGWPVRAAAGLLLAAGVGGAAWRAASQRDSGLAAPAAIMASDTAAFAPAVSAAPASGVAGAPLPPGSSTPEGSADAAAPRREAPEVAAASPAPAAAPADRARERGAGGSRRRGADTEAGGAIQLAIVDSAAEARAYAAAPAPPPPPPEPTPPPPPPPPPEPAPPAAAPGAPGVASGSSTAPRRADRRARARVAGVDSARMDAARPTAAPSDVAGLGAVPGCFVLGGAPRVDGVALPLRVTLDSAGRVTPAVGGLTARWTAVGDSLRLVWGAGKRRRPPRLALRLGPPDPDGVRRGAAVAANSTATPASARPVRCDGALR